MQYGYVVQKHVQNPDATMPLTLAIQVVRNRPDEEVARNVKINAARDLPWVKEEPATILPAVMVGGGPSVSQFVGVIHYLQKNGGKVFALNGAAKWLNSKGVVPDYQVIADAKAETASLVDPKAKAHLIGSQVDPATLEAAKRPILWHYAVDGLEDLFPPERVSRGGYAMFGGAAAVGPTAMAIAYGLGHRSFHVFGYDSCSRDRRSHAYEQPMNDRIPMVDVEWGGKTYTTSVVMKGQAEAFLPVARELERDRGCSIEVYGDGLLQAMYRTKPEDMTERDKYRVLWTFDEYRSYSPGEAAADTFIRMTNPDRVIDFGCGTGRASVKLAEAGYRPVLVDFSDNCRDEEALSLPFIEADLTKRIPLKARYGFCADVMEHIPTSDVETVIRNVMGAARGVFFQISTGADNCGALIGATLHNTVKPAEWWRQMFVSLGYRVAWESHSANACQFLIEAKEA